MGNQTSSKPAGSWTESRPYQNDSLTIQGLNKQYQSLCKNCPADQQLIQIELTYTSNKSVKMPPALQNAEVNKAIKIGNAEYTYLGNHKWCVRHYICKSQSDITHDLKVIHNTDIKAARDHAKDVSVKYYYWHTN